jgi:ribonuclease HI
MKYTIYTDGACKGNPGPGSASFVILDEHERILSEGSAFTSDTTNNRQELLACITALKALQALNPGPQTEVRLFIDSKYVRDGITSWIGKWKRNNWKTSEKKPVKNQDLWQHLDALDQYFGVDWHWVKGHHTSKWNNYVDQLCNQHF